MISIRLSRERDLHTNKEDSFDKLKELREYFLLVWNLGSKIYSNQQEKIKKRKIKPIKME